MFCPKCKELSFPTPDEKGNLVINCPNYECGYKGPAELKIKGADGKEINLAESKSSTKSETRKYEVIEDSGIVHGVLTTGSYFCDKCHSIKVYSRLEQTRSSDEPETRMLTCKDCGHGWREY